MDFEERISYGGCKGVMLCDRPFEQVESSEKKTYGRVADAVGFICGTVKRPWGSNVAIPEKERVLNRLSQKNVVLNRHKKWLSDLQKRKEERSKEKARETEEKETRKRNFMARAAKRRAQAKENNAKYDDDEKENAHMFDTNNPFHSDPNLSSEESNNDPNHLDTYDKSENDNNISKMLPDSNDFIDDRPAWALTENVANRTGTQKDHKEEENLLAFVQDLDFEKYSEDLELKILMNQVKQRIQSLVKDTSHDQKRLQVVEEVELAKQRAELYGEDIGLDEFLVKAEKVKCNCDDMISIADTIRSDHSIRSIHSQKSMSTLIFKAKEKLNVVMEPVLEEPVFASLVEDGGRRLAETKSLNKLPFKNRNPAL